MKKTLILLLLFIVTTVLQAQTKYEKRIEFELDNGYYGEQVEPMGESGFLIISENKKKRRGQIEWRYQLYNNKLELDESKSVFIKRNFSKVTQTKSNNTIHTLFKRKDEFLLVNYDSKSKEITTVNSRLPRIFSPTDSYLIGNYFYVTGLIKRELVVFRLNWKTGNSKIIPINTSGFDDNPISILDFQTIEKSKEVFIYLKEKKDKKASVIHVYRFREDGTKIEQYLFDQNDDNNIVSLSASKLKDGSYILTGTYSTSAIHTSEGIFFAKVNNRKSEYINYHKFFDLNNFLNYLPERKQERIEKKITKKKKKGKDYTLSYNIINHDIIQTEDGYIFLGEAYYPTYITYTSTSSANGVTTTNTYTVFDGFQYTHAMAAKFDLQGNLSWDVCFEMNPRYKPFKKIKFISVATENKEKLNMIFASRDKINSKSIECATGKVLKEESSDEIITYIGNKKTRQLTSYLDYWYDNYFLSYGVQQIKSKENENRTVFFVSKVSY